MKYMRAPAPVRFERLYIPEPNSGCWLWLGAETKDGYGEFSFRGRKHLAHRASYAMFCGEIHSGIHVLHHCDNPACVNPNHLFVGNHAANMQDMVAKGRNAKKNRAILTVDDVATVRLLLASGLTHRTIAKRFGVSRPTISCIARNETWQ